MILEITFFVFLISTSSCGPILEDKQLEDDLEDAKSAPFHFAYSHNDGFGNEQQREETADEFGEVRGSYSFRDADGIYRHVSYLAGADGFRAVVRTNEPGMANKNSADVAVVALTPPPSAVREKTVKESAEISSKLK